MTTEDEIRSDETQPRSQLRAAGRFIASRYPVSVAVRPECGATRGGAVNTPAPPLTGVELIAAERQRQIDAEGWTPDHDAEHFEQELARAAACYAKPYAYRGADGGNSIAAPSDWPWEAHWWKPTPGDRIRELVKAGALIAAEIDRLSTVAAGVGGTT